MIFNGGMTIWILAIVILVLSALAGWRLGGIRAAIGFVGILASALLAVPLGKLFYFVLPFFGAKSPITVWALAPVCGFIAVTIVFSIIAFNVHRKIDVYYHYKAGDLRLALWQRLNMRLGICLGLLNGVLYFILISFFVFNLTYWTTQATAESAKPSFVVRTLNGMGQGLESTRFAPSSVAVGTMSPNFYKYADLAGFLAQNPQAAARFAQYPAFESLWENPDMQFLVCDSTLTNALATGTSVGEILAMQSTKDFLMNKELRNRIKGLVETNLDDLTAYLPTGKSAKYDGEKIRGHWQFNAPVTLAWFRQSQPKIQSKDMAAIRALWSAAYSQATFHLTVDNQVFVKNFPRFVATMQPGQPPFSVENWTGDWTREGESYTIHLTQGGQDKFVVATTTDGLRLSVKDGRNLLFFDRVD